MQAYKLTDNVWWVGAIDWNIRDFHGYATHNGSTYNAYLVLGEKNILIDTVKAPFRKEMLARISNIIEPSKIDYIISNHTEMDHSGALPSVINEVKPEKVFASKMGVQGLNAHYDLSYNITEIKDGETISLGNRKFTFLETKMLHWPDSMVTYLHDENILFSQDGFGMHLASNERFDDQIDLVILKTEATKYYANILTPFSPMVLKVLDKLNALNLDIKLLAPDHGPVWRKNINKVLEWYKNWAEQKATNKIIVTYATMWQSTAKMAKAISDGLAYSQNLHIKVLPLAGSHRSDIATELLEAKGMIIGSPTLNNQIFPTVADVLTYTKGLKFQNKIGASFGSFGWSGEATKIIDQNLSEMKFQIAAEKLDIKYVPKQKDLDKCFNWGKSIASQV